LRSLLPPVAGILALLALSLAAPADLLATSYYVAPTGSDLGDGSPTRPWRRIQRAADVVNPGDSVNVLPGDYHEFVTIRRGGTESARIRFVSTARWGARVRYSGPEWHIIWVQASYVDVEGFDISDPDQTGASRVHQGIYMGRRSADTTGVRILGNHVHDIRATGCDDNNGGAGINDPGLYNVVANNYVHHIGRLSDTGCNLVHGIYISQAGSRVENNIVHNNQGCGIHAYHQPRDAVIVNNLSFHNGTCGLVVGGGEGLTARGVLVANNILYDNLKLGIYERGSTAGNTFRNNLVFRNPTNLGIAPASSVAGTLVADPRFVNYRPDGSGNYRLQPSSPAIDAGTVGNAPAVDFDRVARPQGAGVDMGPYEFVAGPPAPPSSLQMSSRSSPAPGIGAAHRGESAAPNTAAGGRSRPRRRRTPGPRSA
jgi:parallel beta-helix repeat protein